MERGVIVGGLMIGGSFLLAAVLNRSAMEETPAPTTPSPTVVSPVIAPAPRANPVDCSDGEARTDPDAPSTPAAASDSDLMVNGPERCPR